VTQTLENDGYVKFRRAMQDGRLQAGMTCTQNELCELLGVSLSPLRETLVLLEEFGLVEIKPRTGIHIVYPEVAFIRENFQFRIMIETHAVKVFAGQVAPDWIDRMRSRHEEARHELVTDQPFDAAQAKLAAIDRDLHGDFVRALDNKAILQTHTRLQENISMARRVHQRSVYRGQLLDTIDEHLRIVDALAQRDLDGAVVALEAHFRASTHRTFAAV
jgi:DNA-binding GntR family transcriptional regulator